MISWTRLVISNIIGALLWMPLAGAEEPASQAEAPMPVIEETGNHLPDSNISNAEEAEKIGAEDQASDRKEAETAQEEVKDSGNEKENHAEELILLSWPENPDSVHNEVEIFEGLPDGLSRSEKAEGLATVVYDNMYIYSHQVLVDIGLFSNKENLYWRVRAVDQTGNPLSYFSLPRQVAATMKRISRNAPLPNGESPKSPLLYNVYSYTGNPYSKSYEIEIDKEVPENLDSYEPSKYRAEVMTTALSDYYDRTPRKGTWYWRVRGIKENGEPNGVWSLPQKISLSASGWMVGIFGDSISHGGGHLYHSPADGTYSYESYLSFPAVNLSRSGDTTKELLDRFDKDVKPFHLKYLLIMGGINDIRAGVPAKETIDHLRAIQEKCRKNHIEPILLTVLPINPAVIAEVYHSDTSPSWREALQEVNAYIRTQPHIDTAAPFDGMSVLPEELALDGIHGDWNAKEMVAAVINEHIQEFIPEHRWNELQYK